MPSALFGLGCLLVFAVVRAVQDTFFGNVFQSISFFIVASLAFGLSTAVFGAWAWHHNSKEVRALINQTRLFIALNATTAVAWIMYFFALKNIEPAIVNTLYTGIGPIAVLVLAQLRISMAHRTDTSWTELLGHFGVLASLVAIAGVAVLDQSGLAGPSISIRIVAVTVAVIGGVIIAISHMIARRLGDLGIGSAALMGLRYPLTFAIAVVAELALGQAGTRPEMEALPLLALAAFGLIVIPSFFLQLGIARTSPLTVNVMRALGPIFVFAAQQFDGRLRFSGATLACTIAFAFFAVLTSSLRGWAEARQVQTFVH